MLSASVCCMLFCMYLTLRSPDFFLVCCSTFPRYVEASRDPTDPTYLPLPRSSSRWYTRGSGGVWGVQLLSYLGSV